MHYWIPFFICPVKAFFNTSETYYYSQSLWITLYSTIQYNTGEYSTLQYNTVEYSSTVQYSTVQYSIIQKSTVVQYSSKQYSTLQQYSTIHFPPQSVCHPFLLELLWSHQDSRWTKPGSVYSSVVLCGAVWCCLKQSSNVYEDFPAISTLVRTRTQGFKPWPGRQFGPIWS